MFRAISGQVVVITGASSGIGRCTALHLSRCGARVVITARRTAALREIVAEIEGSGGEALALGGDVTRKQDLQDVAEAALDRFGRIDTWVNNAGIFMQGRAQDITLEEFRRVLEVNFLGVVNGTQCALEVMLPRGTGVIVQVSSVAAKRGVPFTAPYSASKAAIDGFVEATRAELVGSGVHLSVLYPPPVDTPIYHSARTRLGVMGRPGPPVSDPLRAAKEIRHLAETGARSRFFGLSWPLHRLNRLSPAAADWLLHHLAGFTYTDFPAPPLDNLDAPIATVPAVIRMGWREEGLWGLTLRDIVRVLPLTSALGAASVGLLAGRMSRRTAWKLRGRRRRSAS